jgi:hypothetical protein
MTHEDVLRSAADLIERDGLCRDEMWPGMALGTPYQPGMACCPLGAIAVVTAPPGASIRSRTVFSLPATVLLRARIEARCGHGGIVRWAEEAELAEILATLRGL